MSKPLNQQTDEELMAEFQGGNDAAFTLLVARYKDQIANVVFRLVGEREESQDIAQEAFVRVFRRKGLYRPPGRFSTWIYTIALNLARTRLRRRALRRFVSLSRSARRFAPEFDLPDDAARPDEAAEATMVGERIQHALDELPSRLREAVVLRDVQDLTYEEISAVLRVPVGTVKSRINRARVRLQAMLHDLSKG